MRQWGGDQSPLKSSTILDIFSHSAIMSVELPVVLNMCLHMCSFSCRLGEDSCSSLTGSWSRTKLGVRVLSAYTKEESEGQDPSQTICSASDQKIFSSKRKHHRVVVWWDQVQVQRFSGDRPGGHAGERLSEQLLRLGWFSTAHNPKVCDRFTLLYIEECQLYVMCRLHAIIIGA